MTLLALKATCCCCCCWLVQVPDLDCKQGNGVRRLDRYDQLSAYLLVSDAVSHQ
jgi:hypothetical protein